MMQLGKILKIGSTYSAFRRDLKVGRQQRLVGATLFQFFEMSTLNRI